MGPAMKYLEMDNSTAWQELLPNNNYMGRENEGDTSPTITSTESGTITKNSTFNHNLSLSGYSKCAEDNLTPIFNKYRHSRIIPGRLRKRVVLKNGVVNLSKERVSKRGQRYLQDIFTTMVDIKWRWNLLVFALGFILSWLGFAVIWWLIAMAHGDFDHINEESWTPCVMNLRSFTSAFLFSIESQHTIGYGFRYTTEECPEGIFIMCMQSVTGVMIQCLMAGIVFAKLSRPKKRSQTLMFSRNATVCLRDGKLCLMFRVGDMRKSHIISAQISAQLIRRKLTLEGEVLPYYHTPLDVRFDDGGDSVFLIWPATIVHVIDDTSPFYEMSAEDILKDSYELVVILEGTIESTGQSIQARSSYIPNEILWGHRFEQVVRFRRETGEYLVDYSKFNTTYEVETPLCSAKDYYSYTRLLTVSSRATSFVEHPQERISLSSLRRSVSAVEKHSSNPHFQQIEESLNRKQ
ncbi:G protein-activated inward rectifier potassium channel 3-like [Centruroides sculpturatus]|uniref:G protein-activated inward rectifier potassium channel 3-like n=1 Tax=Centruroides sculpturatus TaxID=218467 RepID=UPI000C6E428A|nr:G protein-activated inward rectifier potassium channel 3-like [Centruroides sculpturatus]XP_023243771.1 G protein-activated inward rectifier potassium channel 3-like [Centruroides sculpturatus]XP_023243772.1 G protein-activated inward rectifier potassium channel 3-like [Centruroides sculpturatus]XP_023243773.1 G protein-activated inward rectifier potassium channel 3-like [Centruroides sculpturatus]XP_023243774.1 G protein-activated inward rectifier potassium channel 3-like [Centruroides scul